MRMQLNSITIRVHEAKKDLKKKKGRRRKVWHEINKNERKTLPKTHETNANPTPERASGMEERKNLNNYLINHV